MAYWIRRTKIEKNQRFETHYCSECGFEGSYDYETGIGVEDFSVCPNCGEAIEGHKTNSLPTIYTEMELK